MLYSKGNPLTAPRRQVCYAPVLVPSLESLGNPTYLTRRFRMDTISFAPNRVLPTVIPTSSKPFSPSTLNSSWGHHTKRKKSYAKENRRLWRCQVEAYPSLTSGAPQKSIGFRVRF